MEGVVGGCAYSDKASEMKVQRQSALRASADVEAALRCSLFIVY